MFFLKNICIRIMNDQRLIKQTLEDFYNIGDLILLAKYLGVHANIMNLTEKLSKKLRNRRAGNFSSERGTMDGEESEEEMEESYNLPAKDLKTMLHIRGADPRGAKGELLTKLAETSEDDDEPRTIHKSYLLMSTDDLRQELSKRKIRFAKTAKRDALITKLESDDMATAEKEESEESEPEDWEKEAIAEQKEFEKQMEKIKKGQSITKVRKFPVKKRVVKKHYPPYSFDYEKYLPKRQYKTKMSEPVLVPKKKSVKKPIITKKKSATKK